MSTLVLRLEETGDAEASEDTIDSASETRLDAVVASDSVFVIASAATLVVSVGNSDDRLGEMVMAVEGNINSLFSNDVVDPKELEDV